MINKEKEQEYVKELRETYEKYGGTVFEWKFSGITYTDEYVKHLESIVADFGSERT